MALQAAARAAVLCLASLLLSGCVGVLALHPESRTYEAPFTKGTLYSNSAGQLRSTDATTRQAVLREWGEPSGKEIGAGTETWVYNPSNEWCGVVLGLVLPIPLMLPACHTQDRVVLRGDSVVSVTTSGLRQSGIMCGLFVNGLHGGPGFCTQ